MLNKNWKILLFVIAFICSPIVVRAQGDIVRVDAEKVPLDGNWHDYELKVDEYVYCPLTLKSNGKLDVSIQTNFKNTHYVYLLDQNYETICYDSISGEGEAAPQIQNYSYDLTAGNYYVRVESWNECQGKFQVKAVFTESATDDENLNTSFQKAVLYTEPQVTGFLSSGTDGGFYPEKLPERSQNFQDYYRLDAAEGNYNIQVTGADPDSSFACIVYDAGYQEISREYDPASFSLELKDGTYYVCVISSGNIAGDYILKINIPEEEKEPEPAISKLEMAVGETVELKSDNTSGDINWGSTDSSIIAVSKGGTAMGLNTGTVWVAGIPADGSSMILYQITVQ